MQDKNPNIIDYISVLVRWRKLIIINFLIFTFFTAAYSLVMPKTFSASTTILPPGRENDAFGLAGLISDLPLGGFGLGGVGGETNIFLAILNSRTVMETIANKFKLAEIYKTENMEETVRVLRAHVAFNVNDDGTIVVSASAETEFLAFADKEKSKARLLAKDMANSFVEELDGLNTRLKTEKARNNRIFVEKRYFKNLKDLQNAEEQLKAFQQTHGVVALPEQTEATIQTLADLKAQIVVKEMEAAVLSQYVSGSHAELNRTQTELEELRIKFDEIKSGKNYDIVDDKNGEYDAKLFIPLNEAPDLGLKYVRLFREVQLQQKILEFLLPQYEQAKIQEAKDTPTVQVLDMATEPIRRSSPKRTIMVLFSGFLSLIMSICLILIFEYLRRIRAEGGEDFAKIRTVFGLLKRDQKIEK